jgi:hypothetical protein
MPQVIPGSQSPLAQAQATGAGAHGSAKQPLDDLATPPSGATAPPIR